jgi:hypothetical protein
MNGLVIDNPFESQMDGVRARDHQDDGQPRAPIAWSLRLGRLGQGRWGRPSTVGEGMCIAEVGSGPVDRATGGAASRDDDGGSVAWKHPSTWGPIRCQAVATISLLQGTMVGTFTWIDCGARSTRREGLLAGPDEQPAGGFAMPSRELATVHVHPCASSIDAQTPCGRIGSEDPFQVIARKNVWSSSGG